MRISRLSFPMIACSLAYSAAMAQAVDRVAYVERQVVRYEGDRAVVVKELVATVTSDPVDSAPAVAARTFRSGSYHAGHDCPNCGREQTRIADDDGPEHTHVCSSCGTSWHHVDAVSAGPTLKIARRLFGR